MTSTTVEYSPVPCLNGTSSHVVQWSTLPDMFHNGELSVIGHTRGDCLDCGLDGF